ncbi:hypothetical protein ABZP36_002568 [Zizania latifolia]
MMGYLALEYLLTGRATKGTDVFSFSMLVLEVACRQQPIESEGRCNNLVEWVWSLHGEGHVLDAVDARLDGEYDEGEMRRTLLVGLACSSLNSRCHRHCRYLEEVLRSRGKNTAGGRERWGRWGRKGEGNGRC